MLSVCQHLVLGALIACVASTYLQVSTERCGAEQLVRGTAFDDVFRITITPHAHEHWSTFVFGAQITNHSLLAEASANIPHRATLSVVAPEAHADWRVLTVPSDTAEHITLLSLSRPPAAAATRDGGGGDNATVVLQVRVTYLADARGCYGALGAALLTSVTFFKSDAPTLDELRGLLSARCGHLQDAACLYETPATRPGDLRRRYVIFAFLCALVIVLVALR